MSYLALALLLPLAALVLWQWQLARRARRTEGTTAPELPPQVAGKLREQGKVLLYFFSPHCGPCRAMTPHIDRLAARHDNVFKFDVAHDLDLARRMGIAATPTTVLISEGRIARVSLGAVSEKSLQDLLA